MLRANLRYFNVDRKIDSVLITSSAPADGKSTVAMHLASATAAAGARVLLLEADLRNPTLARRLGVPGDSGVSQVLAGQAGSMHEVAHRVPVAGRRRGDADFRTMDIVVSGPIPPNPTDLIESERMREIIREAEHDYDLVVIDTPPTSVVSDAIPLVKEVSGVIVVARLGKTTPNSESTARIRLMVAVRSAIQPWRTRCNAKSACCSSDFTGTKRMFGRITASQMASASLPSFLPLLR